MGSSTSKKGRKCGRMKIWCQAYRARNQRGKNKVRRLERRVARHPNDARAKLDLKRYTAAVYGRTVA